MKTINLEGKEVFPSKIICIGRNYVDHIKELGNEIPEEPVIFIKPNSSIAADIQCSEPDEIHFEGEISIVVLSGEIAGVGFGLDLTKRKLQSRLKAMGLPWERSKAFDGAAVFSEFAAFEGQVSDLGTRNLYPAECKYIDHFRIVKIEGVSDTTQNIVVIHFVFPALNPVNIIVCEWSLVQTQ